MKKFILGTVFTSSMLLLGATGQKADAATSALKNLDKTVTVTKDNVRLYSDSKLKKATKVKDGTVYDVNGYRVINGKKYYRVYQKGYKGYLKATDTKDLKAKKESKKVTYAKDYTRWSNLFFNGKKGTLSDKNYYEVKYSYTLGNGVKYYSLCVEGKDGKSTWQGYVNSKAIRELKATSYGKNISVKSGNYKLWSSFYFNKDKGTAKKGKVYSAERYYKLGNGRKYYSLYEIKADGSKKWAGYVNADATQAMKSTNVADKEMQVKTATTAWGAKEKRSSVKKGTKVIVKRYYKGTDGKKYYSAYTTTDKWLGYICESDLATPSTDKPAEKPHDSSNTGNTGSSSEEKPSKPDTGNSGDTTKPSEPSKPEEKPGDSSNTGSSSDKDETTGTTVDDNASTTVDITSLQNAIKDLEEINKEIPAFELNNDGKYDTVLKSAQDTLEAAKKGKADTDQVKSATKQVEDFINGLSLNGKSLTADIEKVKDQFDDYYMTQDQEKEVKSALEKQIDTVKKGGSKISNWDNVKEAEAAFEKTLEDMKVLPTEKEGKDLQKAIDDAKKVSSMVKGHGEDLFDHYDAFEKAEKAAENMMTALKKDQKGDNKATQAETAKSVSDAAGQVNHTLNALTVDEENTKKFAEAAQKDLKEHPNAQVAFDKFVTQLKSNDTIDNYEAIITTAQKLVEELQKSEDSQTVSVPNTAGKSGRELVKAVKKALDSEGADDKFVNSETVKNICENLERYYDIAFPEGKKARVESPRGLDHNVALDHLYEDAPTAEKYIQQYAKDVDSVSSRILAEEDRKLDQDMNGLQLITEPLKDQLTKLEVEIKDLGQQNDESYKKYDEGIEQWLNDKDNTKALNVKDVYALYQNIESSIKAVEEKQADQADKEKATPLKGITEEQLNNPQALSLAVMDNEDSSESAKKLAGAVAAYHKIDSYTEKVGREHKDLPILVNNKDQDNFENDGFKASDAIRRYAENTKSISKDEMDKQNEQLRSDLDKVEVSDVYIQKELKEYQTLTEETKTKAKSELVSDAEKYCADANNRGIENWNDMIVVQKALEKENEKLEQQLEDTSKNSALPGVTEAQLKDSRALAKAVAENNHASEKAQKLAKTLLAFWAAFDSDQKNSNLPGLENTYDLNKAVDVDSVEADKDLKAYVKDTKAMQDAELQKDQEVLAADMDEIRVSPIKVNEALEAYAKAKGLDGKAISQSDDTLVKEALKYADNGDGRTAKNRGLEHYDDMVKVQNQLKEATK